MKANTARFLLFAALVMASAPTPRADVSLPALFSDNMLLQQNAKVPVWGWADDGETVIVAIADRTASATAQGGKWRVALDKLNAGGPFVMTVTGKNTLAIQNILIGEVWVCGGQSNMQWPLRKAAEATEALANADRPRIRLFKEWFAGADERRDNCGGEWVVCDAVSAAEFSAVGYHFGRHLNEALDAPVGLIQAAYGGTNAGSWMSSETLRSDPDFAFYLNDYANALARYPEAKKQYDADLAAHEKKMALAKTEGRELTRRERRPPFPPMSATHLKRPSALYNGMITPLQPYAIRGAIWYQGESNAGRPAGAIAYEKQFRALIENWRADWGQGAFPFLFVQLSGFGRGPNNGWAWLRESQLRTLSVENTAMAVAIDLGDESDIHPKRKRAVGDRLALAARAKVYGERLVYSGPIYESMRVENNEVVLEFQHIGGGLVAQGDALDKLRGFTLRGKGGEFVAADARIEGSRVIVSSPAVAHPIAVRYGWAAYSDCNLFNKEGLPASPFRTDGRASSQH